MASSSSSSSSSSGVVFCPDKYECIAILMSKIVGYPLDRCDDICEDLNPYDETQLPNIFKNAQTKDLYFFFNKLSRKGKSGSKNVNRTAGKGTWHGETTNEVKYNNDDGVVEIIGTQHTFKYKEEGSVNDNGYLMTEYRLRDDTCVDYDMVKNGVFCVLRFNGSGKNDLRKKKRKSSCDVNNNDNIEVGAKRVCSSSAYEEAGLHQTSAVNDLQIPALTFPTTWGQGNFQQMMMMSGDQEFQVGAPPSNSQADATGGGDVQLSLLERHLMNDYDDEDHNNNNLMINSSELVEIPALSYNPTAWDEEDIQQLMTSTGEEFQVSAVAPSSDEKRQSEVERMQQFERLQQLESLLMMDDDDDQQTEDMPSFHHLLTNPK